MKRRTLTAQAPVPVDEQRRAVLKGGLGTAIAAVLGVPFGGCAVAPASERAPLIGFKPVGVSLDDAVRVPEGYSARPLLRWGEPVGIPGNMPAFTDDASSTAVEQAAQAGMHHDGMHYFALPGVDPDTRGLLATNHEYTDEGLLHKDGHRNLTAEKVRKSQAAVGVSVVEVERRGKEWTVVRPSRYARRVTASSPITLTGPAAGHPLLRTTEDLTGREARGTLNNCAHGYTPWGTYLTCEENFQFYFGNPDEKNADHKRSGYRKASRYGWERFDERFDLAKHPNEGNRFGWVVEIDPLDPASKPAKRTALGRFSHEGAWTHVADDGHVVVYLGDDARNEYIYKFVSRGKFDPRDRSANMKLLDEGTLHVARFGPEGRGTWVPLVHGTEGLTAENGFRDQGEVLIKARLAAERVGATPMDRPEWIAVHPVVGDVYVTLTNNSDRGKGAPVDGANPRANNVFGHIVRWREGGGIHTSRSFKWEVFALAGDPKNADAGKHGNIAGDAFGSPDGLWFDSRGVLWIQTDVSTTIVGEPTGDYANLGNNMMLACDPATREVRRFLTGPRKCEVTGVVTTPDMRTMFVNIQHPGETGERVHRSRGAESREQLSGRPGQAAAFLHGGDPARRRGGHRDLRRLSENRLAP